MAEEETVGTSTASLSPDLGGLAERTVAVFAEALARFQLLLTRNRHRFNAHEELIAKDILEKSEGLIPKLFPCTRLLREPSRYSSVATQARLGYWALHDMHRQLRHLSVPMLLPESITFINFAWSSLCDGDLPPKSKAALKHAPALCLSDSMQPSEHGYGDVSVVSLSKIDHANSLAWPLLLHELGHNAIRDLDFTFVSNSEDAATKTAHKEWLIEIGCDLIGLRLAGPAYLAPFVLHALMQKSFFGSTTKHPAPAHRAQFLLQWASKWTQSSEFVQTLQGLVAARIHLETNIHKEITSLSGTKVYCFYCNAEQSTIQAFKTGDLPLDDFVRQFDEHLPIVAYDGTRFSKAKEIASQLQEGILAGSSHDRRLARAAFDALVSEVEAAKSERGTDAAKRIHQAFVSARAAVCDTPNNLFDIATASWIRYLTASRERLWQHLIPADTLPDFKSRWERFKLEVAADDDLLRLSIESADFHDKMRGVDAQ